MPVGFQQACFGSCAGQGLAQSLLARPHLPELFVGFLQVIGSLFSFVLPRSLPFFLLAGQLKQGVLAVVVLSLCVKMHSSFGKAMLKVRHHVRSSLVTAKGMMTSVYVFAHGMTAMYQAAVQQH